MGSTSSASANQDAEAYNADFEHLPVLAATRDKVAAEAETVMNQAVQQSLNVSYFFEAHPDFYKYQGIFKRNLIFSKILYLFD